MATLITQTIIIIILSLLAGILIGVMFTFFVCSRNMNITKKVNKLSKQCKQYIRRMLPEHKCKYCGCMTKQPDSECYARLQKPE